MSASELYSVGSRLARVVIKPMRKRQEVTHREAVAAARARVAADRLRGAETDPKILALAGEKAD